MSLPQSLRKLALTVHVTASVGWLGAVAAFLALALAGLAAQDAATAQALYLAMILTTVYVIVPLALAALLTGVISSLSSPWGLVRHYWVVAKLSLVVVATIVLLAWIGQRGGLAGVAEATAFAESGFSEARLDPVIHSVGGLLILLAANALAIYKPQGRIRYRRERRRPATLQS
jgi:hypothetical protein